VSCGSCILVGLFFPVAGYGQKHFDFSPIAVRLTGRSFNCDWMKGAVVGGGEEEGSG
jgi:hypothetical protein